MRKILVYGSMFFIIAALLTGCGKGKTAKVEEEVIPVKVMKVRMENLERALEYVGNIKGQDEAVVYPKVSGKIIEKVKEEGSKIIKGEAIAYIDRDEVGLKFEKAPVESPLSGAVGRVYVDIGSSVTPQTAIALVTDCDNVEIGLDIPEKFLPGISLDQEAQITVDARPGTLYIGKVTMISPVIDLATRTAPIEITVENKDYHLQSGMFAKVKVLLSKEKETPVVLREAIIGKEPEAFVYIVEGEKAYLRKVSLGIKNGPYYEVIEGLKEGDLVVMLGQQRLQDGASVVVEE